MILRKFTLVIALLFSVCFAYSQSYITVYIDNTQTTEDYNFLITFNQDGATPNTPPSDPVSFTVYGGTSVSKYYEFDEYDVNVESVRCIHVTYGPAATIDIASGYVQEPVYPLGYLFDFYDYAGQDEWEEIYLSLHP